MKVKGQTNWTLSVSLSIGVCLSGDGLWVSVRTLTSYPPGSLDVNDAVYKEELAQLLTFRDLMWPHMTSPSPYDDLSRRYSKIASLL